MSGFILLQERSAERKRRTDLVPTRISVEGGELVREIPLNERVPRKYVGDTLNYSLYHDHSVALYDDGTGVSLLSTTELQYLAAVTSPETRLLEYREPGKLKWVMRLRIGDTVVFRPVHTLAHVRGKIQYCGTLSNHIGVMFGIEILDSQYWGRGTTDGRPHFKCGRNNAVYVSMDRIVEVEVRRGYHDYHSAGQQLQEYSLRHHGGNPTADPSQFTVNTIVAVGSIDGVTLYGTIRWIGTLRGYEGTYAGIQLDNPLSGCSDGRFEHRRYFTCPDGTGLFCQTTALQRYNEPNQVPTTMRQDMPNPLTDKVPQYDDSDTPGGPELFSKYIGDEHGIQGHHNSSYLDATVFGLFALSDSFDIMLLEEPESEIGQRIKHILWKGIVNPLRKFGVARCESIMELCNELQKHSGAYRGEKDPQEFLNLLFKKYLYVEPFIKIKYPFGIDEDFFVQLFMDIDKSITAPPSTEELIRKMFNDRGISFTTVPCRFLLLLPRFRDMVWKTVIPSLELDVMPLLDPAHGGGLKECAVCLEPAATMCCLTCTGPMDDKGDEVYLCKGCSDRIHNKRPGHKCKDVRKRPLFSKMQLLSVICADHYVCFTRDKDRWLFHDSMADRLYDTYNIPRVTDVSQELNQWVYNAYAGNHQKLLKASPREVPECVRRFTQDIYMCVYVNPDLDRYGGVCDQENDNPPVTTTPRNLFGEFVDGNTKQSKKHEELQRELEKVTAEKEQEKQQHKTTRSNLHYWQEAHQTQKRDYEACEREKAKLEEVAREFEQSWKVSHSDVFVTEKELGRGGWGYIRVGVFREQNVAVKQLYKLIVSETNLAIMNREISTMSRLRHPNLLLFIGAALDHPSGNPLIITEIMDISLREAYEKGQLTGEGTKLSVLRDTAAGLNYLHCHPDEIIHRDVSSANVLLESRGLDKWRAKLSDFGSANKASIAVTYQQGSQVYSAPESKSSLLEEDEDTRQTTKMDVYSYGILVCEVMAGQFPSYYSKFHTMLQSVSAGSPSIGELIKACISKTPNKRPTMQQVIKSLDNNN